MIAISDRQTGIALEVVVKGRTGRRICLTSHVWAGNYYDSPGYGPIQFGMTKDFLEFLKNY